MLDDRCSVWYFDLQSSNITFRYELWLVHMTGRLHICTIVQSSVQRMNGSLLFWINCVHCCAIYKHCLLFTDIDFFQSSHNCSQQKCECGNEPFCYTFIILLSKVRLVGISHKVVLEHSTNKKASEREGNN